MKSKGKNADIFGEMAELYDKNEYVSLTKLCRKIIQSSRSSLYDLHVAHSFLALSQLRTHKFSYAVKNAEKALEWFPTCPWARWVALYAYEANGINRFDKNSVVRGIGLGEEILSDGTTHIERDLCSNNISEAGKMSLLNDSRFLLAFLYADIQCYKEACYYLQTFWQTYPGTTSEFTKEEAEEGLARVKSMPEMSA